MVTMKEAVSRQSIFELATQEGKTSYELYSVPHSALKGAEAGENHKKFLNTDLKKIFTGLGLVIDPSDRISRQTDVVIYDAIHCPVYRASEEAAIFPSTNVAAVVEVNSI